MSEPCRWRHTLIAKFPNIVQILSRYTVYNACKMTYRSSCILIDKILQMMFCVISLHRHMCLYMIVWNLAIAKNGEILFLWEWRDLKSLLQHIQVYPSPMHHTTTFWSTSVCATESLVSRGTALSSRLNFLTWVCSTVFLRRLEAEEATKNFNKPRSTTRMPTVTSAI
jgi:hypothetical protein